MKERTNNTDEIEMDFDQQGRLRAPLLQRVAASPRGMVATAHHLATDVGRRVLHKTGNAADAAVAAAFTLGVVEPAACGLGGQTMVLYYDAGQKKTIALDGSSHAPHRVAPGAGSKSSYLRGHCATTVPSTPAVLAYFLRHYGTLKLSEVLDPVIALAEDGYRVSELQHSLTVRELKHLRKGGAAPFFLRNGTEPYPAGALFRQPVLATTLKRLAANGIEDFYQGEIASDIFEDMQANDGMVHLDDLAQIPLPIERKPLSCRFEGYRVLTFGEPGAGRTLIEMLNVLARIPEGYRLPDTPMGAVYLAEVIRRANLDRRDRPFDPNFYPQVQGKRMLKAEYADLVAKQVKARLRIKNHGETTHLSVMDKQGNMVALTQSIERVYGSFAASPKLGFLYNNYMSAFEYEDITHPHYLRPTAVPWASVSPTIVFKGRKPWLTIGSPGSERIASAIVQVLTRLRNQSPYDAVAAPRLHCSIQGKVSLEAARLRDDIPKVLRKYGFSIDRREPYSFYMGCVQLVMRDKHVFIGVADPRRDGTAGGPIP